MNCFKIFISFFVLACSADVQFKKNGEATRTNRNTTSSPPPTSVTTVAEVTDTGQSETVRKFGNTSKTGAAGVDKVPDQYRTNPVEATEAKGISVFCNFFKLEEISKSNVKGKSSSPINGKQENTIYERIVGEWRKLTPDENATVSTALMNNNITSITDITSFAKLPTECVLQHKLTGITFEQAEALILKEHVDIVWHTMEFLDDRLKVQLFSSLLNENKLPDFMKEVLGRSFGGTIVGREIHGIDSLGCHWLGGAITDRNINVATFINIVQALAAAKCEFKNLRGLTALCSKAEELLRQDTLHQVIATTKHLLPYCEMKECKAIFTNVRLVELISDPRNVAKFDFDDIPWLQPTPPCEDINRQPAFIPAGSPCAVYLAEMLSKEWHEMTAATWRSLGSLQPFYDMTALQKQINAVTDSPCLFYNFYDLYKWRGAYLGVKCQRLVASCSSQAPLRNLSITITNTTVNKTKNIAGYLPFIHENVIQSCPNDTLCNPEIRVAYINVLPYGKHHPIIEKCSDDLFEIGKVAPLCKGGAERLTRAVSISKLLNETEKLRACLANDKCRPILGSFPRTLIYLLMSKLNLTQSIGMILKDPGLAASLQVVNVCNEKTIRTMEKGSKLTASQCSCVRDQLLKEKHISKWMVSDLRKYQYVVPCLTPQMMKEAAIDADTLAATLCSPETARYLPHVTKRAIADKMILRLDPSVWPHTKGITTDRMLAMGTCLTQLPTSYIKEVPSDVCKEFCRQFRNQLDLEYAVCEPITNFHRVVDVCKKCIQTNASAPLTSTDIMALGLLSCGLANAEMSSMSRITFLESIEVFSGCAFMKRTTEAVFLDRIVQPENFGRFSKWNSSTITRLGRTITYLNRTSLAAIQKHVRDQTISQVDAEIWSGLACIGRMFGATTASFVKERNHAVSLAFRKPQELRFRRYNDPKSRLCNNGMDTVPHLEKVSHDITPNELNGIPKENFASCLSTLGAHQGWSEAQKNTLLIRVNADINEICKLSPQEVMSSQHILTAVTKSHLRCIDLNDLDILTTLGNPSMNWTSEKLVHLADRYKVLNPYFKLSNSSTEAIVSLGLVLCGFMEYEIESIDPAVCRKISVIVGTYTACPVQKVKALLDLATRTAAYGPVAKWTCSTISDVGILMVPVPGVTLALLGDKLNCIPEHIFALIPPSAIKAIPESSMALLTPAVFNTLTPEQLRDAHLTDEQMQMALSVTFRPMAEARKASAAAGYLEVCLKTIIFVTISLYLTMLSDY